MLRVIDWNFSYQGSTESKLGLLKSVINEVNGKCPCIIALQEVTRQAYSVIAKEETFYSHSYSLDLREPGQFENRNRGLGCLLGLKGDIEVSSSAVIDRALFPERALCTEVKAGQVEFELICFHSLTGVAFRKAKSAQFAALADHLNSRKGKPTILCGDFNEPEIDHLDLKKVKFFDQLGDEGKYAGYILNPGNAHDLQDTYRLWLQENQHEYEKIKGEQGKASKLSSAPLAVSHILTGGIKKRYDYIMVSPHWKVKDIEYRYEDAIKHGGDHAVVVTDLEWK